MGSQGREEGKGQLAGKDCHSHTTRLHPKQGWSPGEDSTWGADGKALTSLKSGQPLPGTPETEMSAGGMRATDPSELDTLPEGGRRHCRKLENQEASTESSFSFLAAV